MPAKPCDIEKNWREMTLQERLEAIRELLVRLAADYDVPLPNVERGPAPDNPLTAIDESKAPASYDPTSNTIFINQTGDNFNQVLRNAGHEFAHEMFGELFGPVYDKNTNEEIKKFLDDTESFAASEEEAFEGDLDDECRDRFKQSPGKSDNDPGDWNMPPEGHA